MAKQQNIEKQRAEWGSDVIVDAIKAFDIEYIAINHGATSETGILYTGTIYFYGGSFDVQLNGTAAGQYQYCAELMRIQITVNALSSAPRPEAQTRS